MSMKSFGIKSYPNGNNSTSKPWIFPELACPRYHRGGIREGVNGRTFYLGYIPLHLYF